MRLKDRTAIVTGGGSGLGRAVARRFAAEGARVVIADINAENGKAVEREITEAQGEAFFVRCDVASAAETEAMVAACVARYGGVDIVYANAAIERIDIDAFAHELTEETWDKIMGINLKGIWLTSKYTLIEMLKAGRGSLILAASPTGLLGVAPDETAYSTSKGGVAALCRTMASAYARKGIRVNAIVPGFMDTPMNAPLLTNDAIRAEAAETIPMGRLGIAEDIAGLAAFLASDEAAYCTGGFYMCDGGLTAV